MTIRQAPIPCIIVLCIILMSDVSDAKCTCCKEINDYCCETANMRSKDACCVANGDIRNKEAHDWSKTQCPKENSTELTPGLWEVCRTDKECHRWNANMVCVHKHRVVESKYVETKLIVSEFLKEIEPGQCQLVINPCKDVTFGGCENEYVESRVLSKKSLQTIQLCNAECYDAYNCTTYRYNNQTKECTLTTNERGDYRALCNIRAGPVDKSPSDCLAQIDHQICDSYLEEECEYNGEILKRYPKGTITGAVTCQKSCEAWAPDCKYWIFHRMKYLCILKKDGRKTCTVWGGPKQPSYDHCKNQSMPRHALYF